MKINILKNVEIYKLGISIFDNTKYTEAWQKAKPIIAIVGKEIIKYPIWFIHAIYIIPNQTSLFLLNIN